jgi:hypothetical protein
MADSKPSPPSAAFEHVPNLERPIVIESYCRTCGMLVGASLIPQGLTRAELAHTCSEWLKIF